MGKNGCNVILRGEVIIYTCDINQYPDMIVVVWLVVLAVWTNQQQQKLRKSSVGIICQKPRHNYDIIWGSQTKNNF